MRQRGWAKDSSLDYLPNVYLSIPSIFMHGDIPIQKFCCRKPFRQVWLKSIYMLINFDTGN